MIAAIIHFDDAPLEKGCVRVVPGSYKNGPLPHLKEGGWHLPLSEYPVESALPCEAKAGDVLFFSYLTIHGSGVKEIDGTPLVILVFSLFIVLRFIARGFSDYQAYAMFGALGGIGLFIRYLIFRQYRRGRTT